MTVLNWSRFKIDCIREYEYVVGIDFGDRNTSAHYVKLEYDREGKLENHIPEKAHIVGEDSVIPTQFSQIGNDVKPGRVTGENTYMYFKKTPKELEDGVTHEYTGIECKKLVQNYITRVIENIETINHDLKGKKILYIIGCPSGGEWLKDGNDVRYAGILNEKNGRDIVVLPESRAALIKMRYERNITLRNGQGIIVFDFGSCTADWTFMYLDSEGVLRMIDGSAALGARLIDRKIMECVLEENGRTRGELYAVSEALVDTIDAKEKGFDGYDDPEFRRNRLIYETKDGEEIKKHILSEYLEMITGEKEVSYNTIEGEKKGSWQKLCREFMQSACEKIRSELPEVEIKNVMLTGGASKMYFIKRLASEVFDDIPVILDDNPSVCVSKGLAYAGFADIGAESLIDKAMNEIENLLSKSPELSEIRERYIKSGMPEEAAEEKALSVYKKTYSSYLTGVAWKCAGAVAHDELFYEKVFHNTFREWGGAESKIRDYSAESSLNNLRHRIQKAGAEEIVYMKEDIKKAVAEHSELYSEQARLIVCVNVKDHYGVDTPDNINVNISDKINDFCSVISRMDIEFISEDTVREILGSFDGSHIDWYAGRPLYFEFRQLELRTIDSRNKLYNRYTSNDNLIKNVLEEEMYDKLVKDERLKELSEKFKNVLYSEIREAINSMALFVKQQGISECECQA